MKRAVYYPAIKEKVLVLHVKHGYEDRAEHITNLLNNIQIPFSYILDGDVEDITDEVLNKYFKTDNELYGFTPRTSCTYKHFLAYEYILSNHLDGALILEDDIILQHNFLKIFNKTMDEIHSMHPDNIIISYENSRLRFIPRSIRIKGRFLYKGDRDRMAGVYYINNNAAKAILDYVAENKCIMPIDLLHCQMLKQKLLTYYWCQPTIAAQGSFTGLFKSSLSSKKEFLGWASWQFKLAYKKTLYYFR